MDPADSDNDPDKQIKSPADSTPSVATDAEPEPTAKKPEVIPQQSGHKKRRWIWLLLLIVIIAGGAYWWFALRSKANTTPTSSSTSKQSQTAQSSNSFTPATVAYAFKDSTSVPYTFYWRLATGGDRTPVDQKLDTTEAVVDSNVSGQNVVVATSKAIYVSTDTGKTYKTALKLDTNEQVTSVKFATDGHTIVYGDLPAAGGKNTVKTMSLDGSSSKTLFTDDKAGVFIIGYSSSMQKVVYTDGCYNCDGGRSLPNLRDLKTSKATTLVSGPTTNELVEAAVSNDFGTLVYAQATENSDAPEQALGVFTGAPYTINTVDIGSSKTTKITSFGTKGEKNTNGTLKTRQVHIGFVAGTNTPYYTDDTQLFTVKSGSSSMVYEASKPLLFVPFVGDNVVIAGNGDQTADYTLASYNIATKKSTTIFSGDNNTVLFGITTK